MICYKNLNLPTNLLNPNSVDQFNELKNKYVLNGWKNNVTTNVEDFLSEELLYILKQQCNIKPKYFILFGSYPGQKGFLHSDQFYENNKWHSAPCSINWEIVPDNSIMQWYQPLESVEEFEPSWNPNDSAPTERDLKNVGVKYYVSQHSKDSSQFKIIDSLIMDSSPRLFRTDVPHQTCHTNNNAQRVSMAIRFELTDVPTWERALEIFKPILG